MVFAITRPESDIYLSGIQHEYLVPGKYSKNTTSIIYPGKYAGDLSKVLSLFIPGDDALAQKKMDGNGVSLLIFYDRIYSPTDSLLPLAKGIAQESTYVGVSGGYFEYLQDRQEHRTQYFLTFNPHLIEQKSPSVSDYVGEVQIFDDVEIGGIKKESTPLCLVHSVIDGFAAQISLSGTSCDRESLRRLKDYQDDLLRHWRKISNGNPVQKTME